MPDEATPIDLAKNPRAKLARKKPNGKAAWVKAERAYQLRLQGKSHSEIADILEIAHTDDVWRLLGERFSYEASYFSEAERTSILALEMARLDKLQDAVWEEALTGDPTAVGNALKIIQTRAKIAGLEATDPVVQKQLVLVMGEKEDEYIRALQQAAEDD